MKVGIIAAMEDELLDLHKLIENCVDSSDAGCEFYSGKINGIDIVLLKSGIGKVSAALGTTLLIERYKPDFIINTGVAGGFGEDMSIGDIVISNIVSHHDADATCFGYEYGQIPGYPPIFKADERLITFAENAIKHVEDLKVKIGEVYSGDSFIQGADKFKEITEKFPDISAIEMEGAGIAQVCHQFEVPFIVIRSISDIVGSDSHLTYEEFLQIASKNSAKIVLKFLEEVRTYGDKLK